MKCPHCEYTDGWGWYSENEEEYVQIIGEFGDFYFLDNYVLSRKFGYDKQNVNLIACPSCRKTFIEV